MYFLNIESCSQRRLSGLRIQFLKRCLGKKIIPLFLTFRIPNNSVFADTEQKKLQPVERGDLEAVSIKNLPCEQYFLSKTSHKSRSVNKDRDKEKQQVSQFKVIYCKEFTWEKHDGGTKLFWARDIRIECPCVDLLSVCFSIRCQNTCIVHLAL